MEGAERLAVNLWAVVLTLFSSPPNCDIDLIFLHYFVYKKQIVGKFFWQFLLDLTPSYKYTV